MKRFFLWALAGSALYLGYLTLTDEPELHRVLDQADRSLPPLPTVQDVAGKVDPVAQRVPDVIMAKQALGAVRDRNHIPKVRPKKLGNGAARRQKDNPATSHSASEKSHVATVDAIEAPLSAHALVAPMNLRQPWIQALSGEQASVTMVKDSEQGTKCLTQEQCPGSQEDSGISVIGVVVDTKKMASPVHSLVDGRIGLGDARKTPAVYVH